MKKSYFLIITFLFFVSGNVFVQHAHAQVTFQKTYDRVNSFYGGGIADICKTHDHGIVFVTSARSTNGLYDVQFVKIDSTGKRLWSKFYDINNAPSNYASSVIETADHGFLIAAGTDDSIYISATLIQTDSLGQISWEKTYSIPGYSSGLSSVRQTDDGGFITCGNVIDTAGNHNALLLKLDGVGNVSWCKTYVKADWEFGFSVIQTRDKGYLMSGFTWSDPVFSDDAFLVKTDSLGNSEWAKSLLDLDPSYAYKSIETNDSGYMVLSMSQTIGAGGRDVVLMRLDSTANIVWLKTYGGSKDETPIDFEQTTDGGYVICGLSNSFNKFNDAYVIKTDANGDTLWTKGYGTKQMERSDGIEQTSDGGYIIGGEVDDTLYTHYSAYLVKTDTTGNSHCNEYRTPTIVSTGTISPNPIPVIETIRSPIVKIFPVYVDTLGWETILCNGVGINEIFEENSYSIYPNPTHGDFTISFNKEMRNASVEIFNVMGEIIYRNDLCRDAMHCVSTINLHSAAGIYLVRVLVNDQRVYVERLIIE